jgi:hypothetical protein
MTWLEFLKWSALLYIFYYGVNILLDLSRGRSVSTDSGSEEALHFTENNLPTSVLPAPPPVEKVIQPTPAVVFESTIQEPSVTKTQPQSAIEGMGVTIKELLELAQKEAIDYTKKVSFA